MNTMTGSGPAGAFCGVNTLTKRQSSLSVPVPAPRSDDDCGQLAPKLVASSGVLANGPAGCGGIQRSASTGGCAYGIPRYSQELSTSLPPIAPCVTVALQSVLEGEIVVGVPPSPDAPELLELLHAP